MHLTFRLKEDFNKHVTLLFDPLHGALRLSQWVRALVLQVEGWVFESQLTQN